MSKRRKSGRRGQARAVRMIVFLVILLIAGLALHPSDKRTATPESTTESVAEHTAAPTAAPADSQTAEPTAAPADQAQAQTQAAGTSFQLSDVPAYAGAPYVAVNNNVPYFSDSDLTAISFEQYGDLDSLGRCTAAYASIGQDLMPTEKRGDISSVKPTGWHYVKYDGIDGKYLYNRCHLIGYQLTAENANEKNLITGTRYMNVEGMEPFENMTADYIKESGNHVLYRVTPIFEGNNLVASGVLMEGKSVEDNGAGVLFCVYCYNVQPGITIDYATGDSSESSDAGTAAQAQANQAANTQDQTNQAAPTVTPAPQTAADANQAETTYIGNANTHVFHRPDCSSVARMSDKNKVTFSSREEAINAGYDPCEICNP
ncbi:MAG: DNA/RNA non-specific endonuclease [Chordicoccus sp.]